MSQTADQPAGRPSSGATSPSLLLRVRENQVGAWDRLVDLYAPLVYHWCRRAGLNPDDAADVFQDVFQAVAVHLGQFRHDRASDTFRGWLRTIAQNKIRDHFRRLGNQPLAVGGTDAHQRLQAVPEALSDSLSADPEEEGLVQRQLTRVLESLRGEFEPRTWQAFWSVQMEGRDTDLVGSQLGMTPAAVRKAKFRVLRRLRQEVGEAP